MHKGIKITLIVLSILLFIALLFLVHEYFVLRRENIISARALLLSSFVQKHGPLTAGEVGVIRPWMTFAYVNKTFALPQDFLKSSFTISNTHYPNLTIGAYAAENDFNQAEFLTAVQMAITHYL